MRTLMFHKIEHYSSWFRDGEDTTGFTEKVPPHTKVIFNEDLQEWEQPPEPEPEEEEDA